MRMYGARLSSRGFSTGLAFAQARGGNDSSSGAGRLDKTFARASRNSFLAHEVGASGCILAAVRSQG